MEREICDKQSKSKTDNVVETRIAQFCHIFSFLLFIYRLDLQESVRGPTQGNCQAIPRPAFGDAKMLLSSCNFLFCFFVKFRASCQNSQAKESAVMCLFKDKTKYISKDKKQNVNKIQLQLDLPILIFSESLLTGKRPF